MGWLSEMAELVPIAPVPVGPRGKPIKPLPEASEWAFPVANPIPLWVPPVGAAPGLATAGVVGPLAWVSFPQPLPASRIDPHNKKVPVPIRIMCVMGVCMRGRISDAGLERNRRIKIRRTKPRSLE